MLGRSEAELQALLSPLALVPGPQAIIMMGPVHLAKKWLQVGGKLFRGLWSRYKGGQDDKVLLPSLLRVEIPETKSHRPHLVIAVAKHLHPVQTKRKYQDSHEVIKAGGHLGDVRLGQSPSPKRGIAVRSTALNVLPHKRR